MSDLAIETITLRKVYGPKVAVADLSLRVPRGEVFGFLGPNGAGKSTSVKMLLGLVLPSEGSASVLGLRPGHPAAMARIGFLPEHFRFHEWLQASEMLDLHGKLYGLDAQTRRRRIPEVLELVGLSEHAKRPLAGFSKGMLQRIGLAQALIGEPELVFLDEPTSALDPFGRMLVRSVIRELKGRGTTIFLNSHLLGEVEATCDRVSFIREGRILQTLSLRDLSAGHLKVELRVDALSPELLAAVERAGAQLPPSVAAHHNGSGPAVAVAAPLVSSAAQVIELTLPDEEMLPDLAQAVFASGARLYALTPRRPSLEQLFLDVIGTKDSGQ